MIFLAFAYSVFLYVSNGEKSQTFDSVLGILVIVSYVNTFIFNL